jgi:hypothetical protein
MIRNPDILEAFENERIRSTPVDVERNWKIYQEMHRLAVQSGVMLKRGPRTMEEMEHKFRIARCLNAAIPVSPDRSGS